MPSDYGSKAGTVVLSDDLFVGMLCARTEWFATCGWCLTTVYREPAHPRWVHLDNGQELCRQPLTGRADRAGRDAGIVERTVDAPESRDRTRYHAHHIGFFRDVAGDRDRLATGRVDQGDSYLRAFLREVRYSNTRPFSRHCRGGRLPNAGPTAGYQRNPAIQNACHRRRPAFAMQVNELSISSRSQSTSAWGPLKGPVRYIALQLTEAQRFRNLIRVMHR